MRDFRWITPTTRISYTLWLSRDEGKTEAPLAIPGETPVNFASVYAVADAYCEIFFMGANGGWNKDVDRLIAQIRAMVSRRGEDRPYLVIVPYWTGLPQKYKDAFKAAFGSHAVEFPVQDSLCYKNRPTCT